jgi:predicted transcriptional regulator
MLTSLSRRERQILDILYARGRATAGDIQAALPDPPGYSATRALLRVLEDKGHVRHTEEGGRYVFAPKVGRDRARAAALKHLLQTFFEGSAADAAAALVNGSAARMKPEELDRLEALIAQAREANKARKENQA